MPTPAAPTIVTSSQPGALQRPLPRRGIVCSSRSRPTSGESKRRSEAADTATSRHAGTGSRLPFRVERLDGFRLDRVAGQSHVDSPSRISPGCGGLLEPSGDVDGVARREPLLGAGDDLAAADADPALDAELGQGRPHLGRRAERAQRVVLVHRRHAEDGHHRVADELLDGAAVALDDRRHALEVAGEQRTERLRV